MKSIVISVSEELGGWFVTIQHRMGPYFSRQRAVDLALGMATAIRESGVSVDLQIPPEEGKAPALFAAAS